MEALPTISVIVPVYKVEQYLEKCLTTLTGQTYPNLQILLVEDGSPDGSGAICDAWAEKDSRIQVIHQTNQGGGAARNAALDLAKGELLAFVDSDDYLHPELYENLYSLITQGADIAECGYVEAADDKAVLGQGSREPIWNTRQEAMELHIRDTHYRQIIWNKLYRREVAAGIRFPVGTKIDDEYYTYQLLGNAGKLARMEWTGYAYRQNPGSVMHEGFSLKRVQSLEAKQQRLRYLSRRMPEMVEAAKEDLVMTCLFIMQESLRTLKGEELAKAKTKILETMEEAVPLTKNPDNGKMRNLLLQFAQKDLKGTAKLLNFLMDIRILH